jgi:hypothetical protein
MVGNGVVGVRRKNVQHSVQQNVQHRKMTKRENLLIYWENASE